MCPEQLDDSGLQPWAPAKLYETADQFDRGRKLARALTHSGIRGILSVVLRVARHWSPGRERQRRRMAAAQKPVTTRVDVGAYIEAKYAAMAEHKTQIAPNGGLFALTPEERRRVSPTDDFTLLESRVETLLPENGLFSGLRVAGAPEARITPTKTE